MPDVIPVVAQLLDEMIAHQRQRALAAARRSEGHITPEDILQPQDYPSLGADPDFNFEDGQTAGLLSAKVAVVSKLRELLEPGESRQS